MLESTRCSSPRCKLPATVVAPDGTAVVRYCDEHGREAGAELRCERCGRFRSDGERVLMLGHQVRPAKRTASARTSGRVLCRACVQRMADEQLDLFGGA